MKALLSRGWPANSDRRSYSCASLLGMIAISSAAGLSIAGWGNVSAAADSAQKPTTQATDSNRTRNYSFDDLKFDIEKDAPFERSMLPKKIEGYAGQRISIRGFILPTSFQTGLKSFVLVRDNMECCFGPGAALYDCIVVEMAEGKSTDYSIRPVTVEGRFAIEEVIGPGRRHLAIYKLLADKVE
jgi:hypothetical protein